MNDSFRVRTRHICCFSPSDRLREGFRMPARRERWPGKKAGVRKPPKNEPAGQWGEDLAVYGDLARQRVCRGMVLLGSLRAGGR